MSIEKCLLLQFFFCHSYLLANGEVEDGINISYYLTPCSQAANAVFLNQWLLPLKLLLWLLMQCCELMLTLQMAKAIVHTEVFFNHVVAMGIPGVLFRAAFTFYFIFVNLPFFLIKENFFS